MMIDFALGLYKTYNIIKHVFIIRKLTFKFKLY